MRWVDHSWSRSQPIIQTNSMNTFPSKRQQTRSRNTRLVLFIWHQKVIWKVKLNQSLWYVLQEWQNWAEDLRIRIHFIPCRKSPCRYRLTITLQALILKHSVWIFICRWKSQQRNSEFERPHLRSVVEPLEYVIGRIVKFEAWGDLYKSWVVVRSKEHWVTNSSTSFLSSRSN